MIISSDLTSYVPQQSDTHLPAKAGLVDHISPVTLQFTYIT